MSCATARATCCSPRRLRSKEKIDMAEPSADLLQVEGMDEHTARLLASNGIKTMEDSCGRVSG